VPLITNVVLYGYNHPGEFAGGTIFNTGINFFSPGKRLVLRRGIPFGEAYDIADPLTRDLPEHDRGLMFVSYQTSIESQFVFLQTKWVNNAVDPNNGGGQDPIIGQRPENGRARTFTVVGSNGAPHNVAVDAEWVVPTGGGYFFSPSISTIANVLGRAGTT